MTLRPHTEPLYCQFADLLRTQMKQGVYGVGRPLPTPGSLCRTYDVDLASVRRAIGLLQEEGLVSTEPGRPAVVRSRR